MNPARNNGEPIAGIDAPVPAPAAAGGSEQLASQNPAPSAPSAGQPAKASAPAAPAKRYIRTLARDMEVLKQGGVPDLAPLADAPAPARVAQAPAPAAPPPIKEPAAKPPPAPAFRPAPPPEAPKTPAPIAILGRPQPVLKAPPPPPPPPPPAPPVPPPAPKPVPLKTYSSDFHDQVRTTGASTATVLAAEQDAKRGPVRRQPPPKKSSMLPVFGGLALLALGAGGAYYAYAQYRVSLTPVETEPIPTAPIFVNEKQEVSGSGAELAQAMVQSLGRPPAAGTVRELSLAAPMANVFLALELPAPGVLLRNISASPSVAGIVNAHGSASFFFILPAASYTDTFAGMLAWEPAILRDLGALYPAVAPEAPASGEATSTASTSAPAAAPASSSGAFVPGFKDEVVENHDVRVYRDQRGLARILYGYWNQRTLVIARDPAAFAEIAHRLANSRTR